MKLRYIFIALFCLCLLITPVSAAGGSGTENDPYIIQTVAELQSMQNDLSAYYRLANDIDLSGVTWTPIGSSRAPFTGKLDGKGYTISNLVLTSTQQYIGFFSVVSSGATIIDITFQDFSITSSTNDCGGVIGYISMSSSANNPVTLSNINCIRCNVVASGYDVACIVGKVSSANVIFNDIEVSYSNIKSTAGDSVGGIIGFCQSSSIVKITRCNIINSQIHASKHLVGGMIGGHYNSATTATINSCTIQNSIIYSESSSYVGGILGSCYNSATATINSCTIQNSIISGFYEVGGIVGRSYNSNSKVTIQSCIMLSNTVNGVNYIGGILGRCSDGGTGTITSCTLSNNAIIGSSYAASICPVFS